MDKPIVAVEGDLNRRNAEVVKAAIFDLLEGYPTLRRDRIGIKDYSGYIGQRCDCEYGMTPRHGTIVFAVGLTNEARAYLKEHGSFTQEQIAEAIEYLTNWSRVEQDALRNELQQDIRRLDREIKQREDERAVALKRLDALSWKVPIS